MQNTINKTNHIEILEAELNTLRHELATTRYKLKHVTEENESIKKLLAINGRLICGLVDIIKIIDILFTERVK